MDVKQAKEILERYKNWSEGGYAAIFKINELNEALDIAIQCLEDSIKDRTFNRTDLSEKFNPSIGELEDMKKAMLNKTKEV